MEEREFREDLVVKENEYHKLDCGGGVFFDNILEFIFNEAFDQESVVCHCSLSIMKSISSFKLYSNMYDLKRHIVLKGRLVLIQAPAVSLFFVYDKVVDEDEMIGVCPFPEHIPLFEIPSWESYDKVLHIFNLRTPINPGSFSDVSHREEVL